ncbi:GTPase [Streptomyces sp. NPDC059002]|uniref:GTPase n=1 Tax=Streptomyces sp. NPDC059002 TaxID=3346690 RepID=UPI003697F680
MTPLDDLRGALREIAGQEWLDEADATWSQAERRPTTAVAFIGPYDTGKTTLIRRLLVEEGLPVPGHLAVGALPTTDRRTEVAAGDLVFIDFPGLGTGRGDQEQETWQALGAYDAVVFVVHPGLLDSADLERLLGLVDGSAFSPHRPRPPADGALLLVIGRADLMRDPCHSPAGFRAAADGKAAELAEALRSRGAGDAVPPVHTVVADHSGMVGDRPGARPDSYAFFPDAPDAHREVDGIDGLRAALRSLAPRRAELRARACTRFWEQLGTAALLRADQQLKDLAAESDAADAERDRLDGLAHRLDGLDQRATGNLRAGVTDALASVARSVPLDSDEEAVTAQLLAALRTPVDVWLASHIERLRRLLAEAQAVAPTPESGSPADALGPVTDALRTTPGLQGLVPPHLVQGLLKGAGPALSQAADFAFRHRYKVGPEVVSTAIGHPTGRQYMTQLLDGEEKLNEAIDSLETLKWLKRGAAALQVLGTVGGGLLQRRQEKQAAEARARLRDTLLERTDDVVRDILNGTEDAPGWSDAITRAHAALAACAPPSPDHFEARRTALSGTVERLQRALGAGDAPV